MESEGWLASKDVLQYSSATESLTTHTEYTTDAASPYRGWVKSVTYPDGRFAVFSYAPYGNEESTITEQVGQPDNQSEKGVLKGVQTETRTDKLGRVVWRCTRNIQDDNTDGIGEVGVVLAEQSYNYQADKEDYSVTDVLAGQTTT